MNMKFVTRDKLISESEMPTIRHFSATLTPLQVDAELEAAVDHCKRNIEPQLLTQLIKQYLPLHAARQEVTQPSMSCMKFHYQHKEARVYNIFVRFSAKLTPNIVE